jgi:hypothetical protein
MMCLCKKQTHLYSIVEISQVKQYAYSESASVSNCIKTVTDG